MTWVNVGALDAAGAPRLGDERFDFGFSSGRVPAPSDSWAWSASRRSTTAEQAFVGGRLLICEGAHLRDGARAFFDITWRLDRRARATNGVSAGSPGLVSSSSVLLIGARSLSRLVWL